MKRYLKEFLARLLAFVGRQLAAQAPSLESIYQLELSNIRNGILKKTPENPVLRGFKVYSQNEEDGIIQEICNRIGISQGYFLEIGCGNGLENNTHYLLLKGWRGTWVDGSETRVRLIAKNIPLRSSRLLVLQTYVTKTSIADVLGKVAEHSGIPCPDLLSTDIDGNDIHVLKSIVGKIQPKVLCVEYNAKFPPPAVITVAYDEKHAWVRDDYMGASLQAFVNTLRGYKLVCCNISGSNAFFVRSDYAHLFTEYPVEDLYQPLRYHLCSMRAGHPPSLKFLRALLAEADK